MKLKDTIMLLMDIKVVLLGIIISLMEIIILLLVHLITQTGMEIQKKLVLYLNLLNLKSVTKERN